MRGTVYFYMEAKEVKVSRVLNALAVMVAIPFVALLVSIHAGVWLATLTAFFIRALKDVEEAKYIMWMTLSATVIAILMLPFASGYDAISLATLATGGSLASLLQLWVLYNHK